MNHLHELRDLFGSTTWAMEPTRLGSMLAEVELWGKHPGMAEAAANAVKANAELVAARTKQISASTGGAVAVIPLYGCITQRFSWMSYYFGGTTTEGFALQLRAALADPNVTAIIIDVDSGGGSVAGVDELADEIFAARGKKTLMAITNTLNGSAAYYLSSQASELWVSPSSLTGSIGVYQTHTDVSAYMEQIGVKVTFISAGKYKVEGNPYEAMGEEALAAAQKITDGYYGQFTGKVARARSKKKAEVIEGFGQGRVVLAAEAVALGMADKVGTFDQLLAKFGVKRTGNESPYAAGVVDAPAAGQQQEATVAKKAELDDEGDPDDTTDNDQDDDGCQCDCQACADGDCAGCTVDDCSDQTCQCSTAVKNRDSAKQKAEHEAALTLQQQRMRIDLDR